MARMHWTGYTETKISLPYLGKRLWVFPRFAGDCASGQRRSHAGTISEQKSDITDTCSQMILQLHDVYDPNKVIVQIHFPLYIWERN